MPSRILTFVACLALSQALIAQDSAFRLLTEREVRAALSAAAKTANGSPAVFESEATHELRKLVPTYRPQAIILLVNDAINVGIIPPTLLLIQQESERIRIMEPDHATTWSDEVGVLVNPRQIDAPNIMRVVVTRNGSRVEPTRSTVELTAMTTRMGVKRAVRQGFIYFPRSAFAPGAVVVVTVIPEMGSNTIKTMTETELLGIQ